MSMLLSCGLETPSAKARTSCTFFSSIESVNLLNAAYVRRLPVWASADWSSAMRFFLLEESNPESLESAIGERAELAEVSGLVGEIAAGCESDAAACFDEDGKVFWSGSA